MSGGRRSGIDASSTNAHNQVVLEQRGYEPRSRPSAIVSTRGSQLDKGDCTMPKVTPFLWFDTEAEDAARFYTSIFKNSKLGGITRSGEAGPGPAGSVLTVSFEIEGTEYTALNGGPGHDFT